jgi:hypothetical protein
MSHGLPKEKNTLEQEKFADDSDLHTVVKTLTKIFGGSLTIISPDDFLNTTLNVGDTATKLPTTPAAGRSTMTIRNLADPNDAASANKILYIGPTSGVSATFSIGTSYGMLLGPGESVNFALRANKEPYGIAPTGVTVPIQVTEWIIAP